MFNSRSGKTRTFIFTTICFLATLLVGCGSEEMGGPDPETGDRMLLAADSRFKNTAPGTGFIGDEACATCHQQEYDKYQTNAMANSVYPLTADKVIEVFPGNEVYDPQKKFYYRAFIQNGKYYQEEYRRDDTGQVVHRLVREMEYVIGGGTAARAYLTVNNGRYYQLPLAWYTQENTWRFNPGFEKINLRFSRAIPDRCMICHNGYPEPVEHVVGKYKSIPNGISCERCHGPGAIHADERTRIGWEKGVLDPTIVNPKHLSLDNRLDVCQQCHFPGAISFVQEGQTPYSFRPAAPMASHVFLFMKNDPDITKVGVDSHPERMRASACFEGLADTVKPMDCMTCHDPHEGYKSQGRDHFNNVCSSCHAPATLRSLPSHSGDADCVQCHMPRVGADGAPHAAFTDHLIRVIRASDSAPAPVSDQIELVTHFEVHKGSKDEAVYEGMAYVVYGDQNQNLWSVTKGVDLLTKVLSTHDTFGEAYYVLGFAHVQRGRYQLALPWLQKAVEKNPNVPERLNTLAQAYENTNGPPARIEELYRKALEIAPDMADIRVNLGRFLESQNRIAEAVAEYETAIREDPWLEEAQFNAGTAWLRQGDPVKAEAYLQATLRLTPDHVRALGNLGVLFAEQGKTVEARSLFDRAVSADPNNPEALNNLATYHINENNLAEAVRLLQRVVEIQPQNSNVMGTLAAVYYNMNDNTRAVQMAQRALAIDPSNQLARQVLGQ